MVKVMDLPQARVPVARGRRNRTVRKRYTVLVDGWARFSERSALPSSGQAGSRPLPGGAMKSSKLTTKGKTEKAGIGKSLQWRKQQEIPKLFGTIDYYEKYDYKRERKRKR